MSIHQYMNKVEGENKRHVLLIVTPKEEYPNNFMDEEYYNLEQAILKSPQSYISIYEEEQNEIMQYTAFRLFIRPKFCDKYSVRTKETEKVKRLNEEELISFLVVKHFYDTVPYGEKEEEEAINDAKILAKEFLEKYPLNKFEYASVVLTKDSDEANVIIDLDFENKSKKYYFDRVYIC